MKKLFGKALVERIEKLVEECPEKFRKPIVSRSRLLTIIISVSMDEELRKLSYKLKISKGEIIRAIIWHTYFRTT